MKRVLVLSQFYHPDMAATGQVLSQLAEDIAFPDDWKSFLTNGTREE